MVAAIAAALVGKLLACTTAMIDIVVVVEVVAMQVLTGVEIMAVSVVVIVLKFAVPIRYSVDAAFDMAIDLFMTAMTLREVDVNALEFPSPKSLENLMR